MKRYRKQLVDDNKMRDTLAIALYSGCDAGSESSSAIGRRLVHVRDCAGVSQAAMAKHLGFSLRSWQLYEQGQRAPNAKTLQAMYRRGISPVWVLTGEGVALVDASPFDVLDRERMADAIQATTEGLKDIQRTLSPAKYAELVLAAYDVMGGEC